MDGQARDGVRAERGWDIQRVARAWAELMRRLGYSRYGAADVAAVHVTQLLLPQRDPAEFDGMTKDEQAARARRPG